MERNLTYMDTDQKQCYNLIHLKIGLANLSGTKCLHGITQVNI